MSKDYEVIDGTYHCHECEWTGSKSGYYKHKKTKHSDNMVESEETHPTVEVEDAPYDTHDSSSDSTSYEETVEESGWLNWGEMESEEDSTHSMPSPLKNIKKKATKSKRSKRTKAELASARTTSKNLLVMGLGMSDVLMSAYGKGVTLDKSFEVVHKASDKELVAESGVAYMEEKGIFLSDRISKGMVFSAMLGWYHLVPLNDIRKKAERPLFKRGGGLLRRLPLIGRLFRKKAKKEAQTTLEGYSDGQE